MRHHKEKEEHKEEKHDHRHHHAQAKHHHKMMKHHMDHLAKMAVKAKVGHKPKAK